MHIARNLHFLSKNPTLISRKNCRFFMWKTRENVVVLDFLAVANFDFTKKIVKKIWVNNSLKCWGFVKIELLDKNLTLRTVWGLTVFEIQQKCLIFVSEASYDFYLKKKRKSLKIRDFEISRHFCFCCYLPKFAPFNSWLFTKTRPFL